MEKLTTLTGVAVPLRRSNVDTDQIIPAVFLKRVQKSGFDRKPCLTESLFRRVIEVMLQLEADFKGIQYLQY